MKFLIIVLALAASGCATLERHPALTAVGTALIAGSIAASFDHHTDRSGPTDLCGKPGNAVIGSCVGVR